MMLHARVQSMFNMVHGSCASDITVVLLNQATASLETAAFPQQLQLHSEATATPCKL